MRKNVASQVVSFQMVSSTDGLDVTTGTPTVYVTIDGGTQASGSGTATHEGNGCWSYVPTQAETNGNHVSFTMVLSGAISQTVNVYPVAYDPSDSTRLGLTALPNANADAAGGLIISDAGGLDADAMAANVLTAKNRVLHQPTCWYIDSDATGNNDGTSPTDAWQTLTDFSSASAAGMKPGDFLFVNGTFTGESLFLDVDAITVRLKAYIDGTGDTTSTAGVRLEANFIDIEGGEIANFDGPSNDGYGVRLSDKRFCKIRKMRCHDNGFGGILVRSARGTIVEDNFAYDNGVKGIVVSNNQAADPDPNNADVIVCRNFIHGNGRIGLQLGGTNGLENERGIEAYNNIIYNNGIGCRLESAYYVKFHHNWLENNDLTGVDPSALETQTELEIQDGESCEIFENVFPGKTADSNFIDFTLYSTPAKYHKIFRNRVFNNSTGCNSLRIAINETDGIEITDNWFISPNTGATDRHLVLAAALNGLVAGNTIVGAGEGIKFNGVSATAIQATDWTVTENTFDGQGVRAIRTGTLDADATYAGNRFVNQPVDGYVTATVGGTLVYYGVEGGSVNPITEKDATARTDAPNYKGPTTGSFIARDYTVRQVSTDQVTQQSNVTAVLADTADMQPKLGTINDLGNGATLGDNLQDIAGATFDDTTDSLEAIRNRGDAAWTTGSGGGSGSGAYTVTVTVDDGTDPLENATVRMKASAGNDNVGVTDANGQVTFSLDAATYTVTITLSGYSFTSTTLAVSGAASQTYSMTAVTITPSTGSQTTCYTTCYDEDGVVESGVTVYCVVRDSAYHDTGILMDSTERSETSAANGVVQFSGLFKGVTYGFRRGTSANELLVKIPTDAGTTYELPSFYGGP